MRVVTVCGMGFGTSLMLLMDIQSIAKKHGFNVEGEATDLGSAKGKSCDFMVASSEIASELHGEKVKIVPIENLLNKQEIESKVMPVIRQIAEKKGEQ